MIEKQTNQLRSIARNWLSTRPGFYRMATELGICGSRALIASKSHDLVIEGFPRSANTYVSSYIELLNPGFKISHHTHTAANPLLGLRFGLPVIVIIRDPSAAVASLIALGREVEQREKKNVHAKGVSIAQYFKSYLSFYTKLAPYRKSLLILSFDRVRNDLGMELAKFVADGTLPPSFVASGEIDDSKLGSKLGYHGLPNDLREALLVESRSEVAHAIREQPKATRYYSKCMEIFAAYTSTETE